ncbi:MAG: PEP-CTERM sorting domain-containing protein [Tepidisphaeraceae bacterium]|jgi:hypothetical protein
MRRHLSLSLVPTILALIASSGAKAQLSVSAAIGGIPSVPGAMLENFDEPNPSILSLSGNAYLNTGFDGTASPPIFTGSTAAYFGETPANGQDATQFVAVEPGGTATFTFATPKNYFGLYWGTIDPYAGMNQLTFYDASNNEIGQLQGSDVLAANGALNPGDAAYVNITSTVDFSTVVASAAPYFPESFEFDDVAYSVPEPASIGLMIVGGAVLLARRPKTKQVER